MRRTSRGVFTNWSAGFLTGNTLLACTTVANLYGANLSWANLSGANLSGAYLTRADLTGTDLYQLLKSNSVHTLLCAIFWGKLPDDLTLEMMRHDAESCGIEAMQKWADGGVCPFSDSVRDYRFQERGDLWGSGVPTLRGRALLEALWAAKFGELGKTEWRR